MQGSRPRRGPSTSPRSGRPHPLRQRGTRKPSASAIAPPLFAKQEAGIAIRIEPIASPDGMRICPLHHLEPGKCGSEHEQGRAWQVEIRHQHVDGTEPEAWCYEQRRLTCEWMERAVIPDRALN